MTTFREVAEGIEGAFLIGANLALWPLLRSWRLRWGATDDEIQQRLPGDELVSRQVVVHSGGHRPRIRWSSRSAA